MQSPEVLEALRVLIDHGVEVRIDDPRLVDLPLLSGPGSAEYREAALYGRRSSVTVWEVSIGPIKVSTAGLDYIKEQR